jgi:phosphopantetheinyl transferase (holo-ACP synthase)
MIGNDVVDLELARTESNWKRKGFLQKLFTQSEQALIQQHHDPETMVWLLWSMKEAAYKIYNRQTGIRAFIPHKLECEILSSGHDNFKGVVICDDKKYYTISAISGEIIHTVAKMEKFDLKAIQLLNIQEVKKDDSGIPYLFENKNKVPVSVSHHGSKTIAVR